MSAFLFVTVVAALVGGGLFARAFAEREMPEFGRHHMAD